MGSVIATLPGCVEAEHPNIYAPITVDEHITAKLSGSRAGGPNETAVREAARVLAAQS